MNFYKNFILVLFLIFFQCLGPSCAKKDAEKTLEKRQDKAKKLVSVLHTHQYFKKGPFGEEFVIEAQLRSLATKPIKNIILNVHVFDKDNTLIASRRHSVTWEKDEIKEKLKKNQKLRKKGWLLPGEKRICKITFFASQIEPESSREKRKRTINKKYKKARVTNFTTIFPAKHSISVISAVPMGEKRGRF